MNSSDVPEGKFIFGGLDFGMSASFNPRTPGKAEFYLSVRLAKVPVGATRLEWRADLVAVPLDKNAASVSNVTTQSAATLDKWATLPGAVRAQKTVPIAIDTAQTALLRFELQPVNPTNASHGVDTCFTIGVPEQKRAEVKRLLAFDGTQTRELWGSNTPNGLYFHSEWNHIFLGVSETNLLFTLRDVPVEWGEITLLYDAVFVDKTTQLPGKVTLQTLQELERAGGKRVSRRAVVRARGETIQAPVVAKTNLQLHHVNIERTTQGARVRMILHYSGTQAKPAVDVPGFVEIENLDKPGRPANVTVGPFGVQPGEAWGQWFLDVELKGDVGKLQKIRLRAEVSDGVAAPLVISEIVQFPLPLPAPK